MFYVIEDELERCVPESERKVIGGMGHAMHAQDPEAYNALVLDFLARHRCSGVARRLEPQQGKETVEVFDYGDVGGLP
jgi:hypothetical protein